MRRNNQKRYTSFILALITTGQSIMFSNAAMTPILQKATIATTASIKNLNNKPSVAIIGSGAAGLVTARILSSRGFQPHVFEKEPSSSIHQNRNTGIGGVWSYESKSKVKPMYKGLRTNLPRELMAFREKRWGGDGTSMSYVTHHDVQQYLIDYAKDHNLEQYISFDCNVKQLTICKTNNGNNDEEENNDDWPKVEIEWEQSDSRQKEIFDAVCICNGHYSAPFSPKVPGIEHFRGKIMHSVEYDDPKMFQDQTVLCVGGRASGSDLAREISAFAKKVYLSDTSCPIEEDGLPITMDNVAWYVSNYNAMKRVFMIVLLEQMYALFNISSFLFVA